MNSEHYLEIIKRRLYQYHELLYGSGHFWSSIISNDHVLSSLYSELSTSWGWSANTIREFKLISLREKTLAVCTFVDFFRKLNNLHQNVMFDNDRMIRDPFFVSYYNNDNLSFVEKTALNTFLRYRNITVESKSKFLEPVNWQRCGF